MDRTATVERKTGETETRVKLTLDGTGVSTVDTGIPFLDHMLTLAAAHGFIDLDLKARGDLEVDYHHTVEDTGICLGMALAKALGDKGGIRRYGSALVPMDEALARVVMDISNRPFLKYSFGRVNEAAGSFPVGLLKEFFRAVVTHAGITLHVDLLEGEDAHHSAESVFKGFGRALAEAVTPEERLNGAPLSTKGTV
ncbi:MAG: imidazoleglycerol-phosphate dehydratase HisB [Desulfobacteraceae bacterium]